MKMTIDTSKFQSMMSKAVAGASENRLLPITSLMQIELCSGVLTLTTTDTVNTLKVYASEIQGDDFSVVIPVDVFSKLVAKTTSPSISLSITDQNVQVKGNGDYSIQLAMDEEGPVVFPDYVFKKPKTAEVIKLGAIKNILTVNRPAVSKTVDAPHLCSYYLKPDMVLSSDEQVICFNQQRVVQKDVLISSEMMDLLGMCEQEDINMYENKGFFLFETSGMCLYGPEHEGKDKYPVDTMLKYLETEFPSSCKVPKLLLQSVIDRLSLFIEPYDKNGAYISFGAKNMRVTSKRISSAEVISFVDTDNSHLPFKVCVDIPLFQQQLSAVQDEFVEVFYGSPSALKLVSSNGALVQVIALLQDEDLEADDA